MQKQNRWSITHPGSSHTQQPWPRSSLVESRTNPWQRGWPISWIWNDLLNTSSTRPSREIERETEREIRWFTNNVTRRFCCKQNVQDRQNQGFVLWRALTRALNLDARYHYTSLRRRRVVSLVCCRSRQYQTGDSRWRSISLSFRGVSHGGRVAVTARPRRYCYVSSLALTHSTSLQLFHAITSPLIYSLFQHSVPIMETHLKVVVSRYKIFTRSLF